MGKKNQIYAKYERLSISQEDPNELNLVLKKDIQMEKKHVREFDNMFAGKDVIITISVLIRNKNGERMSSETTTKEPERGNKPRVPKKEQTKEEEWSEDYPYVEQNPGWSLGEEG
jgi:hypothetical protein